jgi:pimeloyl-ACP methyl ester carboxylesterase
MNWSPRSRRTSRFTPEAAGRLAELTARAWQPAAELGLLLQDPVYWGWGVPRGDGHPVLVLPGLLGGDQYLRPLRGWLRRIGYTPVRSGLERNPGWSEELVQELGDIAQQAFERGGRPLTIVGHSMGGVLGRSVAVRWPQLVRHVITLGSPLAMSRSRLPERIRVTAIHSRGDRIVRYPGAQARESHAENIEVRGSHSGLAFNAEVYRQLGRLLPGDADGFI